MVVPAEPSSSTSGGAAVTSPPPASVTPTKPALPPRKAPRITVNTAPKKKDLVSAFVETPHNSIADTPIARDAKVAADLNGSLNTYDPDSPTGSNVLIDTVKEIGSVASGTIASIREWANGQHFEKEFFSTPTADGNVNIEDDEDYFEWQRPPPSPLLRATVDSLPKRAAANNNNSKKQREDRMNISKDDSNMGQVRHTILQDLAWPFLVCSADVTESFPRKEEFAPQLFKVRDAVSKAVHGDIRAANDILRFTRSADEMHSVATFDTLFEEDTQQIRRLTSWGTTGTLGTNTTETSMYSADGTVDMRQGLEDDDGNAINPKLLEGAQKTREKRQRRKKLVKFDYPPISSLRQCPRANPEDLPELFFTEGELDQIEDDRYSTMSTDDVEIVAVSSNNDDPIDAIPPSPRDSRRMMEGRGSLRDQPEAYRRRYVGRSSSPHPPEFDAHSSFSSKGRSSKHRNPGLSKSSSGGERRLVKGVQIYLRERSTGV